MSFLYDDCSLRDLYNQSDIAGFSCGDNDLDDFFTKDCFAFYKELLGKTYYYCLKSNPKKIVCAFTLANAGLRVSDLPNARRKKIEAKIPHVKTMKDYPAVLVARLGVAKEFRSKHVGSDVLRYIRFWFLEPSNKTGCRYVLVEAYNKQETLSFYESNGFQTVFSTDEQKRAYRHLEDGSHLNTRLMFYDLMQDVEID